MSEAKLEMLPFREDLAHHFTEINLEWIREMFAVEPNELALLEHPKREVIDRGGWIWFARSAQLGVVGCCAIQPKSDGAFELTKMGVVRKSRGLKVGEQLLEHVLQEARTLPIQKLFLLTNKKCAAAIHLYEKHGFVHDGDVLERYGAAYERCNVAMRYPSIWAALPSS